MNNPSRRNHGSFRFGRLKNHGSAQRVQVETLSGALNTDIANPQAHGFESKAPVGSDSYVMYQDGNADNGAVIIIAGVSPETLAEGDTCVYNAAGAKVHLESGSIHINGDAFGGLIKINDLTTKLNTFIAEFNSHSHTGAGANDTVATSFSAGDYENTDVDHG